MPSETNSPASDGNRAYNPRTVARSVLFASTCAIAASYGGAFLPGGAPEWCAWLLAVAVPAALCAIMALGAIRDDRGLGALTLPLVFVYVVLTACFCAALALPANESAGSELWLGLPLRASIVLYGIGLLPIIVLPVAYAMTFNTQTLTRADLEKVRALAASRLKPESGSREH